MNPADDLTARLQHMAERAKQRPRPPAPQPPPQPAPVARLPIWPAEPELHDHLAPDRHPAHVRQQAGDGRQRPADGVGPITE